LAIASTFRIIKKSTAAKLSPRAQGSLTCHVGYDNSKKSSSSVSLPTQAAASSLTNG